jgi:hypothetical protein
MAARLRAFAVLTGLFVGGVDCAPARAQTSHANSPQADQVEEPESDPPAPSASAQVSAPIPAAEPTPVSAAQSAPAVSAQPPALSSHTPALVSRPGARAARSHYTGPIATLPGFEMLPEGGSRLFVEISQLVGVEEKKTQRTLTYVLKGAHVAHRNNENALVTVHFNTPVIRARLLPSGRDLLFSVDLRADTAPAWKIVNEDDGSATLRIDFPKGSFLPAGGGDDVPYPIESAHSTSPPRATAASAPTSPHASRGQWRSVGRGPSSGVGPANSPPATN